MAKTVKNKKPAAKKPVKKAAKPVAKKTAVKAKPKLAPKKAAKPVAKKPVAKKAAPKKPAPKAKPAVKKPAAKPAPKKTAPAPKAKPKAAVKPAVKKPAAKPAPATRKPESKTLAKSLTKASVSIKPQAQQPVVHVPLHKDLKPLSKEEAKIVRYSDKELEEFRQLIQKKIEKAKEEIAFYQDQIRTTSESETKFASLDDGSVTSEREAMNQIIGRQQKLINHLENALIRIQNKTYGICRETGRLIPKERLRAVPHATLSVEAKKMQK